MSLKFVTKKLENQSLAEEETATLIAQESRFRRRERNDDSGTESDDEREEEETHRRQESRFNSLYTTGASSKDFSQICTKSNSCFSAQTTDEACDIDDNYSSEEELKEIINERTLPPPNNAEKRKWCEIDASDSESESQSPGFVLRDHSSMNNRGDEFTDIATPVQFRSSPPLDVHRPRRSPPPKFVHLSSDELMNENKFVIINGESSDPTEYKQQFSSPAKRHRSTPRPHVIQRPCLDFEKMQQIKKRFVTSWRPKGTELSLFCW